LTNWQKVSVTKRGMKVTHEALSKELQYKTTKYTSRTSEWMMTHFSLLRQKCRVLLQNKNLSAFIE